MTEEVQVKKEAQLQCTGDIYRGRKSTEKKRKQIANSELPIPQTINEQEKTD